MTKVIRLICYGHAWGRVLASGNKPPDCFRSGEDIALDFRFVGEAGDNLSRAKRGFAVREEEPMKEAAVRIRSLMGIALLAVALLALPLLLSGQQPQGSSVLVHLAPGADRGPARAFAASQGGRVQYEYKILPNVMNLRGIRAGALSALESIPGVVRVEEDGVAHAHIDQSTSLIRGLQSQIAVAGLSAAGNGVRVCVLDTGIDSDHIMYAPRIDTAAGRDFHNGDSNPEDDNGHGAHVAGVVLGGAVDLQTGNGPTAVQGVAPAATLIGVKVLSSSGSGSWSNVIAGMDYCADQTASGGRADVMNLSLGGGKFSGACDGDSAATAANNAVDAGTVVVASAGNEGNDNQMGTPACGSKVIAVGATYDDNYAGSIGWCLKVRGPFCQKACWDDAPNVDQIACFSNNSDELDVAAPGCFTLSADKDQSDGGIEVCGTSQAAPHVTGLAALLLSKDPTLTPAGVRQAIRDGAIDLGAPGFDPVYGYGRIDVVNSLSAGGCNDGDGDGYTTCDGDCNDGDPAVNPGASEVCDAVDNNCDGTVDEGSDLDGDGYTTCAGDCDDSLSAINPGATELCDGVDNNCDGTTDESVDADSDGVTVCAGDCDDSDDAVYPGAAELCDGVDNNCDSVVDEGFDLDGDGYTTCAGDCDDNDAFINPDATEMCTDVVDNDCDLLVDGDDPDCLTCSLGQPGDSCVDDGDCCSSKCRGSARHGKTCKE